MDIPAMLDAMSKARQLQRSGYHLTLGKAIKRLGELDSSMKIVFDSGASPGELDSYRGYYSDLSIEPGTEETTVSELLGKLKEAVGKTFTGYKGGYFTMDKDTPLWTAPYGTTGEAIMGISTNGQIAVIETKEVD